MSMLSQIRPALVLLVLMTVLTGLAYPLAVTGIAAILFPYQAGGSLIEKNGEVIGSALIGQNFSDPKSKTIPAPYNAANSGGSNAGPTSKALIERVKADAAALKTESKAPIPVDLVTTSASGLDPEITPAAAEFQVTRVAAARNLSVERVRALVAQATEDRFLGVFGEPRVNVLKLNLALDALK
jgi:K+-transporting ATPase ATPase C chain